MKAYEKWFSDIGVDIHGSGVDLAIIEQVVLTRNSVQHPSSIGFKTIQAGKRQRNKYPIPFFAHPFEERMAEAYAAEGADVGMFHRMLQVTPERLFHAISEVEKLCTWIDVEVFPWSSARPRE